MIKVDCAVCGAPLDPFDLKPHKCLSKERLMKPHRHAELIKAWADGAEIQERALIDGGWSTWRDTRIPTWNGTALHYDYRIKPKQKPDVVEEVYVMKRLNGEVCICQGFHEIPNVRFIWDGETDKLKSIEIIK